MTQTLQKSLLLLVAAVGIAALFIVLSQPFKVGAEDATVIPASLATTSLMSVGPQNATTLMATSSCTARIITTYGNPIMLTFSDYLNQSPTATFGHLQAASTTVVYDAGEVGCGLVKAYGYTASTSITFTSMR